MAEPPKRQKMPAAFPPPELLTPAKKKAKQRLTRIEPPQDEDDTTRRAIRFAAGVVYTTSVDLITVRDLQSRQEFADIPLKTLERWCQSDRWVERRQAALDQWRARIERQVGTTITRRRSEMLKQIDEAFDRAAKMVGNETLVAESFEGAVGAMVRLATVGDKLREKIGDTVPDAVPSGQAELPEAMRPKLNQADMMAAAKAVIRQRREAMRAQAAAAPEVPEK